MRTVLSRGSCLHLRRRVKETLTHVNAPVLPCGQLVRMIELLLAKCECDGPPCRTILDSMDSLPPEMC